MVLVPGVVDTVTSCGLLPDDRAESLIGITYVDDEDGLSSIITAADEVVGKERFTRAGSSEDDRRRRIFKPDLSKNERIYLNVYFQ